jgi:class 3 adenylate cyclase
VANGAPVTLSTKVAVTLASIISLVFFAWAGVVWNAQAAFRDLLFQMVKEQATQTVVVTTVRDDVRDLREIWLRHETRPWHDQAGNTLSTMRLEIDNFRERLQKEEEKNGRP